MGKTVKRKFTAFVAVMIVLTGIISASARASYQLDSYGGSAFALGGGVMSFEFRVVGTGTMWEIGAKQVAVQEKFNGYWITVATFDQDSNPEIYSKDKYAYASSVSFDGIPGVTYRARVTVYATDQYGSDSRTFYTTSAVCR